MCSLAPSRRLDNSMSSSPRRQSHRQPPSQPQNRSRLTHYPSISTRAPNSLRPPTSNPLPVVSSRRRTFKPPSNSFQEAFRCHDTISDISRLQTTEGASPLYRKVEFNKLLCRKPTSTQVSISVFLILLRRHELRRPPRLPVAAAAILSAAPI